MLSYVRRVAELQCSPPKPLTPSSQNRDTLRLRTEVDADVEAGVVPIRVMIFAPLTVGIHSVYVVADLGAVIAVTCGIMVDASFVIFEALMTGISVIRSSANRRAGGKEHTPR